MYNSDIYIPKDKTLRVEIIWLHYDILVAKYRGKQKTIELVMRNYWQPEPEVIRDIKRYIEGYDIYQRMKNQTKVLAGKLKLSEILEKL